MQKMRFFRRCLPLFLAFWLLLAVAGAPFAAYAGESVTVRDSSGQVRYAAPMDPGTLARRCNRRWTRCAAAPTAPARLP